MRANVRIANAAALLVCALFVLLGSLWIWKPGIQSDEALFASGTYPPFFYPASSIRIFKHDVAVMVMSYVGALKGHLWAPVFAVWGTNATTIRFPALIVGAISVWWFYRLLLRTLGVRAAVIGCVLLGTDVVYLLTIRWDWGPVALQHALLVGGMLGVVTWFQTKRSIWLALGFFLFGLALWDKALFAWSLVGLGAATIVAFPTDVFRSLRSKPIAIAVLAFGIGAFPLLRYNVRNHWVTFRSNTVWTTADFDKKVRLVGYTLEGSALFGSMMRDDWEQPVREPVTPLERAVVSISKAAGMPRESLQDWALLLALLLLPLTWRTPARRAVLFASVFSLVTFAQMAFVENGAGGAHHTVLLWPMPQLIIAASLAYASMRVRRGAWLAGAVVAAVAVSNVLVLSTYYTNLIRNGSTVLWTDAIYPAFDALRHSGATRACITDWGFFDNIRAMDEGRVFMCVADDPATPEQKASALKLIADEKTVFLRHTPGNEVQAPPLADRLEKAAAESGFRKRSLGVFSDANGRNVIEIFRFEPAAGS